MALRDHMSGNELAKMAGVGQRSVARILLPDGHKDQQTPSLDVVDAIARALGVQAWFLLRDFTTAEQRRIRAPVAADPAPGVYRLPRPLADIPSVRSLEKVTAATAQVG